MVEDERARELAELDAIWAEHRETTLARVASLEEALRALSLGRLDDATRLAARREAHTLAGSVALFGFALAARLASELEDALAVTPDDAHVAPLVVAVESLRRELVRPVPRAG